MTNSAIVVRLKDIRPHSNADRLRLATVCGNQVIIGLDEKEGDMGIYFETGLQLSEGFCKANDLIRRKDENGVVCGGMFDDNRRVRTQKFRGEISDGFWIPIKSLYKYIGYEPIQEPLFAEREGFEFTNIGGITICCKYIPYHGKVRNSGTGPKAKKHKLSSPMFLEHFNTEQFGKNVDKIKSSSKVIITEKLHGTSARSSFCKVDISHKQNWFRRNLAKLIGVKEFTQYQHLDGTRRVVIDKDYKKGTGFHSDSLRDNAAQPFVGNLKKGETIYYEIIGFELNGASIMPSCDNEKLGKEFIDKYGKETTYSYGCEVGESKIFVYRITLTNEDGYSIDYSWEDVKKRCNELSVDYVPELAVINDLYWKHGHDDFRENIYEVVENLSIGKSTLDNHIKEGVCVRIEGGISPNIMKHKSYEFKFLEGIIKDQGIVDQEEIENITN